MVMQNFLGPDFINQLFSEEPGLSFFSRLQNQRLSPVQRQFYRTQLPQFQDRFMGRLGSLIQGGTSLDALPSFHDFVGGIDFDKDFRSMPPSLRPGGGTARFAPPTRFVGFGGNSGFGGGGGGFF